jgi:hypothetical protein
VDNPFANIANGLAASVYLCDTQMGKTFGMATPGQLVQVMADALGISKATVIQYDRVLAENGLRSRSGRGTSAAKITSHDAANLLIALAAAPILGLSAKDATVSCEAYALLSRGAVVKGSKWKETFTKFGLPTLASLPKGHSFREALAALIDAAGKGEVLKLPGEKPSALNTLFVIRFEGPRPLAEISVDGSRDFGLIAAFRYLEKIDSQQKVSDLRRITTISFRTIQRLGSLVSSQGTVRNDR